MIECLLLAACTYCFSPAAPNTASITILNKSIICTITQDDGDKKKDDKKAKKEQVKKPEYPKLKPVYREKCKRLIRSFMNKNPKKRRKFEQDMIKFGRAAIPYMLDNANVKKAEQQECIYNCLFELMDEQDVETLKTTCYQSKHEIMKRLAVCKIASFEKPSHLNFLKFATKDKDPVLRLEAALGLVAIKDASGVGEIIMKVSENKRTTPKRLLANMPRLKGKAYESMFTPYLVKHENPDVRRSAVKVLLAINDINLKRIIGKALEDPHNLVKTEAVNALRQLVNKEKPKSYRNVFELVEEVNKWKKDLGLIR